MSLQPERPYPMVPEELALRWYLDSPHTHLVVMGARVLDWQSWAAGQISDEIYTQRCLMPADEVRRVRDKFLAEEQRRRAEHGWATLEKLYRDLSEDD